MPKARFKPAYVANNGNFRHIRFASNTPTNIACRTNAASQGSATKLRNIRVGKNTPSKRPQQAVSYYASRAQPLLPSLRYTLANRPAWPRLRPIFLLSSHGTNDRKRGQNQRRKQNKLRDGSLHRDFLPQIFLDFAVNTQAAV